jgi:pimeloyl-ACP methyl ester carboxylesterase
VTPAPTRELDAVSADGSRVHVEVYGPEDGPAVVLSHGWTCCIRFWAAQITDLAADHRVIVYDQRGHGRTPPVAPAGYSTGALADDLEAVLAATLAPGEKAVLAGHSMGGMAVMATAGRPGFAEHAAAVLLLSTGASRLLAESRILPLRAGRLRARITERLLGARGPLGPVTPLSVRECTRIVHACPPQARSAWSKVLATLDLEAESRRLAVPTAVLVGGADRMTPPVHAQALAAALPDCVGLTRLPRIGHMTPVEAPEAVNSAIRALTARHLTTKEGAA